MTATTTLSSPTIERLLSDSSPEAAAALLRQARERGGPLIDPLPDAVDSRGMSTSRVTFLHEAPGATSVSITTELNVRTYEPMERVPGTALWYAVREAADDVRVTYQFCADDPLLGADVRTMPAASVLAMLKERLPRTAADAANPVRIPPPVSAWELPTEHWLSVLTLPKTPPDPWSEPHPGVPAGAIDAQSIESRLLGNVRDVWIYTPPGYPGVGPYPLAVLLDGGDFHRVVCAPTIVDNLLAQGRVRPLVLAMAGNANQLSRFHEYMCNDTFAGFLADELLPWLRARYTAVSAEAASVVVGGVSAGGLAGAHAAWTRPDAFGNVLSMSGSFLYAPQGEVEDEWLTRRIAAGERRPVRWWVDIGTLEREPIPGVAVSMIGANRHLRTVLEAKGYEVQYSEYSGGHDWAAWRAALPVALMDLLGDRR